MPAARNVDIPPSPHPARNRTTAPAPVPFSTRERWVLLGASLWLVVGLQLDTFAHSTIPDLETFWTPWHAVMYSGIAACGLSLLWLLRPRLPKVITYRTLLWETPRALRLPVIGMGLLLVGGGIDTLWHNVFGIEKGLEIFFSPSHYLIIAGMVLVAAGPALMTAQASPLSSRRLQGGDRLLVVISAVLAALPVHIYTLHASALAAPLLGSGMEELDTYSLDAQEFHAYVGSTVLLLVPVFLLGRRWRLPIGAATTLTAAPAFVMCLILGDADDAWLPVTLTLATVVLEVAARVLAPAYRRLVPGARWMILGLVAPIVVWGAVLTVSAVVADGPSWNLHMISGLLALVGVVGAGTAFIVNRMLAARTAPLMELAAPDRTPAAAAL